MEMENLTKCLFGDKPNNLIVDPKILRSAGASLGEGITADGANKLIEEVDYTDVKQHMWKMGLVRKVGPIMFQTQMTYNSVRMV